MPIEWRMPPRSAAGFMPWIPLGHAGSGNAAADGCFVRAAMRRRLQLRSSRLRRFLHGAELTIIFAGRGFDYGAGWLGVPAPEFADETPDGSPPRKAATGEAQAGARTPACAWEVPLTSYNSSISSTLLIHPHWLVAGRNVTNLFQFNPTISNRFHSCP